MPAPHVEIVNAAALQRAFGAIVQQMESETQALMLDTVLFVQGEIPGYPSPPAASTYIRTLTLGRSLTTLASENADARSEVRALGTQMVGVIGSNVRYAPFVVGEEQAPAHQGRWYTLAGVLGGVTDEVRKRFTNGLRKFILDRLRGV